MKKLLYKNFEKILVEVVDMPEIGRDEAKRKAYMDRTIL